MYNLGMADSKKKQTKVYLIPEGETRDSHTYHYLAVKTKKLVLENQKLRIKKFNPVPRSVSGRSADFSDIVLFVFLMVIVSVVSLISSIQLN